MQNTAAAYPGAATGANAVELDTNGLAAGVYVVTYTDAQGSHSVKLVKK